MRPPRHVRDLFVAGRQVVRGGVLVGLDLPVAERELMDRARRVAALDAEQATRHRRRREGVRAYYAGRHHINGCNQDPNKFRAESGKGGI